MISYKIQCNEGQVSGGWIWFDGEEWSSLKYAKRQLEGIKKKNDYGRFTFRIVKIESKILDVIK